MMAASKHLTRAEQRLARLEAKGTLTDAESAELYRSLHAVYVRNLRLDRELRGIILAERRREELKLLERMQRELAKGRLEEELAAILANGGGR